MIALERKQKTDLHIVAEIPGRMAKLRRLKNRKKNLQRESRNLYLISKPIAKYTDEARANCIQGKVVLGITFFADGTVGNFKIIEGLEHGLSEQAIEAAKLIKFKPAMRKGKMITVTKKVSYNFTIY